MASRIDIFFFLHLKKNYYYFDIFFYSYKQIESLVTQAGNGEAAVSFGAPNANYSSTLLIFALFFQTDLDKYTSTFISYFSRREQGLSACRR